MRITREDFHGYMENWDEETRRIVVKRIEERFRRDRLEHFSPEEAAVLEAALARMIPQREEEKIDLVGFVDSVLDMPLGRGDREHGMPRDDILIHKGLSGIRETAEEMFRSSFTALVKDQQEAVLKSIQEGSARGKTWDEISSQRFFIKLMMKAITGFCAHPFAWMRMGFPGPSYPEGYVWITRPGMRARSRHFPGWKTL